MLVWSAGTNRPTFFEEGRRIAQCLVNNTQQYDNRSSTSGTDVKGLEGIEMAKCLVRGIEMCHQDIEQTGNNNLTHNFKKDTNSVKAHEDPDECEFVYVQLPNVMILSYSYSIILAAMTRADSLQLTLKELANNSSPI
jgi:hypothetical protein